MDFLSLIKCMILDAWGWCTGTTHGDGMGRRREGSGWGARVYLWQIHFDIWQNQYNSVKLNKIKLKKKKTCLLWSLLWSHFYERLPCTRIKVTSFFFVNLSCVNFAMSPDTSTQGVEGEISSSLADASKWKLTDS